MLLRLIPLLLIAAPAFAEFTNESELSLVETGGNSDVQTTNAKTTNIISNIQEQFRFGGHYIYGETGNGISARNWSINGKYEKLLSPRFSLTYGEVIEGNRFAGVKARYNTDVGAKYYYSKTDERNSFTEISFRYTIEDQYDPVPNSYDNKARFYNELNQKISESLQYKIWLEVLPNFTDPEDYMINGEASLTSIINSIFSFRVGYLGMFDNRPAQEGFKKYDHTTTTSLVVKY